MTNTFNNFVGEIMRNFLVTIFTLLVGTSIYASQESALLHKPSIKSLFSNIISK